MILWHLGIAALIVYVTLGRARVDYRFVLLGAIAPDVLDAVIGLVSGESPSHRSFGHTLLAAVTVCVIVLLATKGETRLSWFGLGVGWMLHLVVDGMWSVPRTFFWPAFGSRFGQSSSRYAFDDLWLWLAEIAGALILAWFWVAFGLGQEGRAARWLKDGKLRA